MDDAELLQAWAAGDRDAGERLYSRHFEAIYRFFRSKLDGDIADLVQRTFLGLLEAAPRFRGSASVRTYVFAIAKNQLHSHCRAKHRERELEFSITSLADLDPTPSTIAIRHAEQRLLLEALRRLPLELQILVELHYWEGLAGPELAEVLELPEGTVRSRLRRAMARLRDELEVLAESRERLESTLSDLDGWARSLRGTIDRWAG